MSVVQRFKFYFMSNKQNPKHVVGDSAEREKHHLFPERNNEYVKNPEDYKDDEEILKQLKTKWKDIMDDFREKYNLSEGELEYENNDFAAFFIELASKTNKSTDELRKEIRNW